MSAIHSAAIHSETISPRIHVGSWADSAVSWLTDNLSWLFTGLAKAVTWVVGNIDDGLRNVPILLLVIVLALIAWWARGWRAAIGSVIGFVIIDGLGAFPHTLDTLSQILVASVLGVVISVPLGIVAARSDRVSRIVRPAMDFMQTLPAYVYLLPFLFLMGLGVPSAVLATIIFAMPPGVRLAELGIRQVDSEILEAGQSFGATRWEVLRGIQLPLAVNTIMAGVNQVIMLALSMVVIGGIVGAPGLGSDVMSALSQLQVGPGVEAGLAVVILAIYLDRVTDALAKPELGARTELATLKQRRVRTASSTAVVAEEA